MEDIKLVIFIVLMLGISLWYHPQSTRKIIMYPLIGLYVVLDVIRVVLSGELK